MTDQNRARETLSLNSNWKFNKSDAQGAELPGFDDSTWEKVNVPHDWAINGPFDKNNDVQYARWVENGVEKRVARFGATGSLPHVGVGWYRKTFSMPKHAEGKRVFVEFDGIMCHSSVYLNGKPVGAWPYGYSSFCFELTLTLRFGGENTLAVRVDSKPFASRWYPGAGIYRNTRLVTVNPIHVAHWGTYITTPEISAEHALVRVRTVVLNQSGNPAQVELRTAIIAPTGRPAAVFSSKETVGDSLQFDHALRLDNPIRWDIDSPQSYTAISEVYENKTLVDRCETRFGIREIRFDADAGFFLNGRSVKLKGVCLHHDLGPLGIAVHKRAVERQLEIMKEMGCNALRTSHNPPAPEVLECCDRLGMLVLDEAFDEWKEWKAGKCENGYHILFDEWAEKDMRALIMRDRNHPSVIMWSIGNEICEQNFERGAEVAKFLRDICHDEDPTRPVTAALNIPDKAIENKFAHVLDVVGWNYRANDYAQYRKAHPKWIHLATETCSCISTRGEYYFPVEEERDPIRDTHQVSSYDLSSPGWGYFPDIEFAAQDDCPFVMGEFVWTGFDYLGEPTPYQWPSRSSYFGIVDLCGFPKDRYYIYRSKWSDKETLHLLPHWNWEGKEGEIVPVHCYTNYDSAELFLNGKSMGIRRKDPQSRLDRYRLRWNDVNYEPGALRVVAFDKNGAPAAEKEVKTAGQAARVELTPDRPEIAADGNDISFVTTRIVDAEGNLCPRADNKLRFHLKGPGKIAAVGNGDPTGMESFGADCQKAFHGLCMLIVASVANKAGKIRITVSSDGLTDAETTIVTR